MDKHPKRAKKKYTCPNPLFVKWLTEWKQEASEKGLKLQYTYAKALSSLKKYPLPLSSGKEAKILEYFGDKICSMLDAKLIEWRQTNGSSPLNSVEQSQVSVISGSNPISKPKKPSTTSFNSPKKTNIKTITVGRTATFPKATLMPRIEEKTTNYDFPLDDVKFYLFPESFDILLCVDNCETISGHGKSKKLFQTELQKCGVEFEVRKLHVGDFLWIARDKNDNTKEVVLDFVVERKRLDDLAHSIKDGRFREQKFRLRNCGLKKPVYLVENCTGAKYLGLPESTLEQAIVNTQVVDDFIVKRTQNIKESVSYLSSMTRMLKNKYKDQTLVAVSCESVQKKCYTSNNFMCFKDFNCSTVKNKSLTLKEMFAKHLLQFFGLSVDRAAAIVDQFDTLPRFLEAYAGCDSEAEKINLISSIKFGLNKKNIGPSLSKSLLQFYDAQWPSS
ncbi:crossover junction endonuclease MUS81 isoform X1 [Parasteatoda tepidariorum]|uniref:crossover junction endonuclease MUS81 isoform X1 n=2 Tax=Parasteatoda tepidariorum TaxID=114398 RepID=UPI001C71F6FD|nr:crossover junction endonuclease MUS81 isoform X1 [Parasteatoda tepidariorum]XP_015904451.2 crossover junction endonuclease MUS81 isoform X1 [Parasteatoda tepidariorum]